MCHRAHSVFLAARAGFFAGTANPHEINRFVYGRLRAIEKECCPRAAEVKQTWQT